ncbi:protein-disulfide reductase DsbD N-terminal domain-containing protein [Cellulophaga sp. 20_2_10]|uniref:protein-disulfide reductase DsbD domain-containing protein n=1 Tax=Cellulophaga sp. 20_2_10 TaxID=2942476 RepID=UPI00201A915B|nr:protein-disulfide reductase DsbD domain-containing protein [Cellulophaga sp. 20_2_10]MCL5244837.1 protein-disulfide reductase DsbD N-terminal domain-containing protein [Cellulophaga sp. 20_2_10]
MKKYILAAVVLLISISSYGQILDPVKWTTSVKKISATEYDLVATATIDAGWHLYSQNVPEGGPIATAFIFEKGNNYSVSGKTLEEKGHTVDDTMFKMKITYFEGKAKFTQRVKLAKPGKTTVVAEVEFMVCDDSRCLPPTYVDLDFTIQ